ncbi:MAG: hypothetical protein L3J84_12820 [Gammaproteobacteria bacterium]|nr:hypothetical protein [Gammaproteobacteria bacterium]
MGIALDVGQSGIKIHEACTIGAELSCGKTTAGEGGRIIGSVGGGAFGGAMGSALAYGACSLFFAIPSGGTSLFWCGIVGGLAGGYTGGKIGGAELKEKGEILYEIIYQ